MDVCVSHLRPKTAANGHVSKRQTCFQIQRPTSRFAKRELHWLENKLHKHGDVFHISTMGTVDASEVLDQFIYFFPIICFIYLNQV